MDTCYSGLDSQGLSTLHIQISGGRLAIFAATDEILSYFPECNGCLKDAINMFASLDVKQEMPDSFSMPSFCAIYAKTGDVVYCPCGYVCVEKAISETGLMARSG